MLLWRGLPTKGYTMREFIDLAYTAWAEDTGEARRAALDQALTGAAGAGATAQVDREAWGTDPAAVQAHRAMMALAPQPARRRPKPSAAEAP